jgi:hypothetical protein
MTKYNSIRNHERTRTTAKIGLRPFVISTRPYLISWSPRGGGIKKDGHKIIGRPRITDAMMTKSGINKRLYKEFKLQAQVR